MPGYLSEEEFKNYLKQIRNNEITELNLSFIGIGDEGARSLAEALRKNNSLTSLKLFNNKIGDEGARSLAEALRKNSNLTSLNLEVNNIADAGASWLAEGLKVNSRLTSLNLYKNNIREGGARSLAEGLKENGSLTSLNLGGNNIGDRGASALAETLRKNNSLTSLNLAVNDIRDKGARALAEALKENRSLTFLHLVHNKIGKEGTKALAEALEKNNSLTYLDLVRNNLGRQLENEIYDKVSLNMLEPILEQIRNNEITKLNLQHKGIGNRGASALAEALKENCSLTSLNLSGNNIVRQLENKIYDKVSLNMLKPILGQIKNNVITKLNLRNKGIGVDAASALVEALKLNNSLTSLSLSLNNLGGEGARSLAETLKENSSLTSLKLSNNNIGEVGAKELAEALKENRSLTSLDLTVNNIGDRLEQQIYNLISINKEFNDILVGKATKLNLLQVENVITRPLSSDIIINKNINILENLFESNLLPCSLDLGQNHQTIHEFMEFILSGLKKNKGISTLSLSDTELSNIDIKNLANSLRQNHTLYSLDLSRNNIGETGAKDLKGLLQNISSLFEIDLNRNEKTFGSITKATKQELEESLSNNKKINSKLFGGLYSIFEDMRNPQEYLFSNSYDFGAKDNYILNLLKCVGGLSLVLGELNIRVENNEFIANFYKKMAKELNKEEEKIKLSSLLYRSLSAFLFDGEEDNLSLLSNSAKAEECKSWLNENLKIEKQIQANQITNLDLSHSNINDEQVTRFAGYLASNTSLKEFDLSHNNIGDNGAEELAESLEVNEVLERLYLRGNDITDRGASALREVLTENETLKQLSLEDNQIGQDNIDKIEQLLACNRGDISGDIFEESENILHDQPGQLGIDEASPQEVTLIGLDENNATTEVSTGTLTETYTLES